jgi:uroporphyrin-III C-methyltransferase
LTLAAVKAISEADLVVCDRLVSPAIVRRHVHCEIQYAQKLCGRARTAQDDIHTWCLNALAKGKKVVRLKGGDPFVFGRGGEELLVFKQHGYNVQVIPGISSCIAAPLLAGIPVTHRGIADQFIVVTGRREHPDQLVFYPPYLSTRTAIFLMAMSVIDTLSDQLLNHLRYPPDIPVCIIQEASCESEKTVFGTLTNLVKLVQTHGIRTHATLVIGWVVNALHDHNPLSIEEFETDSTDSTLV